MVRAIKRWATGPQPHAIPPPSTVDFFSYLFIFGKKMFPKEVLG